MWVLLFLPSAILFLTFWVLWGGPVGPAEDTPDWRWAFLGAVVILGAFVVLSLEALSLIHAIQCPWLAALWLLFGVILGLYGARSGRLQRGWHRWKDALKHEVRRKDAVLLGLLLVVLLLFAVAWVSPVNNNDSLLYHMSRVAHWVQNKSLDHYPTAYEHQLRKPIWSAMAMLTLREFWGDDQPVALVQWFSLIVSLIGVSAIARKLGAHRRGQMLSAVVALSVPMAILQSTSTQNDLAVSQWLVVSVYYVVLQEKRPLAKSELLLFGLSLGLGALTKGTYVVFILPFLLWFSVRFMKRHGLLRSIASGAIVIGLLAILSLGYWTRNIETYGNPYYGMDVQRILRRLIFWRTSRSPELGPWIGGVQIPGAPATSSTGGLSFQEGRGGRIAVQALGFPGAWDTSPGQEWLASILKHIARNLGTPFPKVNEAMLRMLEAALQSLGADLREPIINIYWNHEDLAGNALHLALVPVSLIALLAVRRRIDVAAAGKLSLALLVGFALLARVNSGDNLYSVRYQLPFFMLQSAVTGVVLAGLFPPRRTPILAAGFMLLALPWLLFNQTRPVIGRRPWVTRVGSVFTSPVEEVAFANHLGIMDEYQAAADIVREQACEQIGLRIDSSDPEYLLWWVLAAPRDDMRIEVINANERLKRYQDPSFQPCLIICTICQGQPAPEGYRVKADYGSIAIYEELID